MGRALIGGLLRSGTRPEQISVGSRSLPRARCWRVSWASRPAADKTRRSARRRGGARGEPQDPRRAHRPWRAGGARRATPHFRSRRLARGDPAGLVRTGRRGLVRAITNRPALVGGRRHGLFAPPRVAAPQRATAAQVFKSVGEVVWVRRKDALDVVTALSGRPGYFFCWQSSWPRPPSGSGSRGRPRAAWPRPPHGSGLLAHGRGMRT